MITYRLGNSLSEQVAATPVRRVNVGRGDEAIFNTMALMRSIILKSAGNYYVRRWAEKIIEGTPRDDAARMEAIARFLTRNSHYVKDPHHLEQLKTPLVSLQLFEVGEPAMLDCDDYCILAGSLLMSIGIPVALRVAAYRPPGAFSHVYLLVRVRNQWVPLDLTRPEYPIGWEPPGAIRTKDLEVR